MKFKTRPEGIPYQKDGQPENSAWYIQVDGKEYILIPKEVLE